MLGFVRIGSRSTWSGHAILRGQLWSLGLTKQPPNQEHKQKINLLFERWIHSKRGNKEQNLQPRKPSMGLTSDNLSILAKTSSSVVPVSAASSLIMSSILPSGKNSWSGGSNSRIVTGNPESRSRRWTSKWTFFHLLAKVDVETIDEWSYHPWPEKFLQNQISDMAKVGLRPSASLQDLQPLSFF